ncbi:MAG TPA: TVP38/TMEM64 family protein [Vicinamibacterales bacterium]|jgi:uncharacterized membrane protein YdjX (TVP38/TMEM64 family)|nr:TVP38/TMEM64 family protein [Vicinamibacterales bacterium]
MTHLLDLIRHPGWGSIGLACAGYTVCAFAMLPAWPLTVALGSIYGIWRGLLIATPASVAGATAVFVMARSTMRDWAQRRMAGSGRLVAISRAVSDEGPWVVFLLRLSPVIPFNLLNYALSVTQVSLRVYVVATTIGMLPPTVLYLYMGSLSASVARGTGYTGWRAGMYVAGLAATAGAVWLVGRAVKKALPTEL